MSMFVLMNLIYRHIPNGKVAERITLFIIGAIVVNALPISIMIDVAGLFNYPVDEAAITVIWITLTSGYMISIDRGWLYGDNKIIVNGLIYKLLKQPDDCNVKSSGYLEVIHKVNGEDSLFGVNLMKDFDFHNRQRLKRIVREVVIKNPSILDRC